MTRFCARLRGRVDLVAAAYSFLLSCHAYAVTTSWNTNSSGVFTTPANWDNGVPDSDDTAVFNRGAGVAYSVTLPGDAVLDPPPNYVIDFLRVNSNEVTFRDNSSPFITSPSLTVANPGVSIVIGENAGEVGVLNTTLINLSGANTSIGRGPGADGTLNVIGGGFGMSGALDVGDSGTGSLNVTGGGDVFSNLSHIGQFAGGEGHATIAGAGSTWSNSSAIRVGHEGAGELRIEADGDVFSDSLIIANVVGSDGEVIITGTGSSLLGGLGMSVGNSGTGRLTVSNGGSVVGVFSGIVGQNTGSMGLATVTGVGSAWNVDFLRVGYFGTGTLNVENGGSVSSTSGTIGRFLGSTGTVTVSAGSTWKMSGQLSVAGDAATGFAGGTGTLNVSTGGTVDVAQDTVLFPSGLVRLQGGTFGTSLLRFNGGGQFQWTSGTLHVGAYYGNLTNPSGGTLAPGRPVGGTQVFGDYSQSAGGTLEIEIGGTAAGTQYDFVNVGGTALIDGELQLKLIDNFTPAPNDKFTVLYATGEIGGVFGNVADGQRLATTDGLGSFLVHYGPTSTFNANQVVLNDFLPALIGDYNENGVVDAADYVVWRENEGTTNPLPNDPLGGMIGQDHYDQWRAHFGIAFGSGGTGSASALVTVPEPDNLILAALAISVLLVARSRAVDERSSHVRLPSFASYRHRARGAGDVDLCRRNKCSGAL